jgi:hypothetical protein
MLAALTHSEPQHTSHLISRMFERTRPIGSPELMRVSEFRRYLHDLAAPPTALAADGTRMPQVGVLGPSLMADLRRSRTGDAHEPLEVLAACMRHGKRVTVHLECGGFALPLTVHAPEQTLQCGRGQLDFLYSQISEVSLLWVEAAAGPQSDVALAPPVVKGMPGFEPLAAGQRAPRPADGVGHSGAPSAAAATALADAGWLVPSGPAPASATGMPSVSTADLPAGSSALASSVLARSAPSDATTSHPLGPVLWQLAIRGLRSSLLSDIAGPAAYRVAPGLDLTRLTLGNAEAAAVYRLRRESATARAMADWPGFDRLRATYLLNALYLQAGLIVSRSHPSAIRDSWFSALGAR